MGLILLILVFVLLFGGIPIARPYGYGVSGLGLVLLIVLIVLLLNHTVVWW